MKVDLVYLIKGKAGKYNQKLIITVGPKFGENYMIENPLPPHITLKYPFEIKNIKKLEEILEKFTSKRKAPKLEINGFANFRRFVAYLKPRLSKPAIKLQKELLIILKKKGIKQHKFDAPFKPHATIAYGNTEETFNKIWNYLQKMKIPQFDLKLDNITILKEQPNDKPWKIHKEFRLK